MLKIYKDYDFVVVGGGMSGLCAAIAAARQGAKTALIHNRPVLGGNASSEIRMHICGADYHGTRPNSRETGILEEILLENKYRNPNHVYSIFDSVLWEKATFQENIDLYLNTHMTFVETENSEIKSIHAAQLTTEKSFCFTARIFMDATGDGTLGAMAGAKFMKGREGKNEFNEKFAPHEKDHYTMGNSLMFKAADTGKPAAFIKPFWANTYTEEDLKFREHGEITSGYWWVELGGGEQNTISDSEIIRDELTKAVYGVWDHIKNSPGHNAQNYELEWVGFLPGKRESRRLEGDYILTEQDCLKGRIFEDAVAYGGWPMDVHVIEGFRNNSSEPNIFLELDNIYTVPYRSLYSVNIRNLMLGGRAISCSHMAFSSTRIMATCAVVGQAAGTAAAIAISENKKPAEVMGSIKKLQQLLQKDDCFIPGFKNEDSFDLAPSSKITASSCRTGCEPQNVVNGITRHIGEDSNCWTANLISPGGEWLSFNFESPVRVRELRIKVDSDLSKQVCISLSKRVQGSEASGVPPQIVKDYEIEFYRNEKSVYKKSYTNNHLRLNICRLEETVECDSRKLRLLSTNGAEDSTVFEVRIY